MDTFPQRFIKIVNERTSNIATYHKDDQKEFQPTTYSQLLKEVTLLAQSFTKLDIKRGDHVAIISDTRREWLIIDLALLGIGAADVPRGNDSTAEELLYILDHAECKTVFVENSEQAKKICSISKQVSKLKNMVIIEEYNSKDLLEEEINLNIFNFETIISETPEHPSLDYLEEVKKGSSADLATIIYTSGTTGEPKGVMLTHKNFIYQIDVFRDTVHIDETDVLLSVLPVWHAYERASEYIALIHGAKIAFSHPIPEIFKDDLIKINPTYVPSVPRIWEGIRSAVLRTIASGSPVKKLIFYSSLFIGKLSYKSRAIFSGLQPQFTRKHSVILKFLYMILWLTLIIPKGLATLLVFKKIKSKLGKNFRFAASGAGALPAHVEHFLGAIGILVLEGYGLTECGPLVSVRKEKRPVGETVGTPITGTEIRLVNSEGNVINEYGPGLIQVRGPQVMKGYYKREDETAKAITKEGWLNTGDIGIYTLNGELKIVGRAKDTIVLLGGENIEPEPIELLLRDSSYIDQAMVVGQDKKFLGALIVPDNQQINQYFLPIDDTENKQKIKTSEINSLMKDEINKRINKSNGFKNFELISKFTVLEDSFTVGKELTPTLKIKRHIISKKYQEEITKMFE